MGNAHYLPSLEEKSWSSGTDANTIGEDIRKFFRQEKIDIKILLRDSDEQAKYELFQRINTGGTPLSDQEVRNCILIIINRDAYFWLEDRSKLASFQVSCPLPDRLTLERYDLELVLRYAVLYDITLPEVADIVDLRARPIMVAD